MTVAFRHRRRRDQHAEFEMLVETYLRRLQEVQNEANNLIADVVAAENYTQIALDRCAPRCCTDDTAPRAISELSLTRCCMLCSSTCTCTLYRVLHSQGSQYDDEDGSDASSVHLQCIHWRPCCWLLWYESAQQTGGSPLRIPAHGIWGHGHVLRGKTSLVALISDGWCWHP